MLFRSALLFISPDFSMTAHQEWWVTSMLLVGAAVGALVAGRAADAWGRRTTLLIGGAIFIIGSLWCALAGSIFALGAARTFLGVAVGGVSIVSPMYIAEVVPPAMRGRLVSLAQRVSDSVKHSLSQLGTKVEISVEVEKKQELGNNV